LTFGSVNEAKMLVPEEASALLRNDLLPAFKRERTRLDRIDRWYRWDHDRPHRPRFATAEYKELGDRSQTPWLGLVVTEVAQSLYVEGYRRANEPEEASAWQWWQDNGMDGRQMAIHRAALAYGIAYVLVLPGADEMTGNDLPVMRGFSPRQMMAFYEEPAVDVWPRYAVRVDSAKVNGSPGWKVRLYDEDSVMTFEGDTGGSTLTFLEAEEHSVNVCPVVRFTNALDLEARADGEVDPFIPTAARIDQTVFDRLVVQRFASWIVRTIAGMAKPDQADVDTERIKLLVEHLLVAVDPDTKFGSLPATPLDGFIAAAEADIRALAAVTQTPPHALLGQMANLSAEALAAAEAGLQRKVQERQHSFGESHEQSLRLAAWIMGDEEGARDTAAQVRWRDMESRSLAQAADALGKIATMLGVPVEMLWEKIPGWTDQDVERAKDLVDKGGGMAALMEALNPPAPAPSPNGNATPSPVPVP
jgi:SPP1 Gp6-like portal protein